jgi:hypothetical protein
MIDAMIDMHPHFHAMRMLHWSLQIFLIIVGVLSLTNSVETVKTMDHVNTSVKARPIDQAICVLQWGEICNGAVFVEIFHFFISKTNVAT